MCHVPPAHSHQPFAFTRIHNHGLEGQHSVPRDVLSLSWSSGVSGPRRLPPSTCYTGVLHYLLWHALGARHPCVIQKQGFGHQGLGTRVWVAACVLLGVSPGCIFPTGCPAEAPTGRGCTTWGCAPRCCSQRLLVSRCILSIGRPAKTISPQCAIGIRYSLFHYGQGYALSSRHFVRLKGLHGTEECA